MTIQDEIARDYYRTTAIRGHERSREYYERWLRSYGARLVPWLPLDKTAACVDLACGCGEFLYTLQKLGYTNLCGVDLCQDELDEAARFTTAELHLLDVREFLGRRKDSSIAFLSALNLLEHLPVEAMPDVFRDIRRVLSPGGTFVAIVPNALSPLASVARYWDITHQTAFSPNSVRQLARLANFDEHVDFREVGPIPHGVKSCIRYGLWQALRAGIKGWMLVESGAVRGTVFTQDMMFRLHRSAECRA